MELQKITLIASFILFLAPVLYGQDHTLTGLVKDKESGTPVSGIMVHAPGIMQYTTTGEEGFFRFNNLKKGKYVLKFMGVGYQTAVKEIQLTEKTDTLYVQLKASEVTMDEVVVTTTGTGSRKNTPYQIESVDAQSMKESGNISMMESLTATPGVEQISFGTGIGKPVIRGLSFSRVMTVYRGSRFENHQWGEDHGLGLNDAGIDRVEIIKGPASLIYGSGALAGVLNIIDEKPADPGEVTGSFNTVGHSNTLGVRADLNAKGTSDDGFFWLFRNSMENHADYHDGSGRPTGNSRFATRTLKADAGWHKDWGYSRFSYTYGKQLLGIINDDEMTSTLATTRNDRDRQLPFQNVTDHLFASENIFYINNGRIKFNTAYHINLREEIEDAFDEVDLGLRLRTLNYDVKYIKNPTKKTEYTLGVQGFQQSSTNQETAKEILMPDASLYDNSVFGLFSYQPGKWRMQAGARFDYRHLIADAKALDTYTLPGEPDNKQLKNDFSGISGSVGTTYIINDQSHTKLNIASGFRAPDLAELYSNGEHPGTKRFEVGDASFNREQNIEMDVSYHLSRKNISFEAASFYNHVQNYIYFTPTNEEMGDLNVWRFLQDDAALYGGEAGIVIHPEMLPFAELKTTFSTVTGNRLSDDTPLPLIPSNRFFSELRLQKRKMGHVQQPYVFARMQNVFRQGKVAEDELETPGYTLVHAGAGGDIKIHNVTLNLNLTVHNVFNIRYFDHMAITRPFGVYNMGRNVRLSAELRF